MKLSQNAMYTSAPEMNAFSRVFLETLAEGSQLCDSILAVENCDNSGTATT